MKDSNQKEDNQNVLKEIESSGFISIEKPNENGKIYLLIYRDQAGRVQFSGMISSHSLTIIDKEK